jgi:hypothetical protein
MSVLFTNDVIYHVVCQINMSDVMMNIQTCATDNTTYPLLYFRSICQIYWWMYIHMLLITLLTPWCLSDQYVRFNDKCTHKWYWLHYLHHVLCQITMSDLMMNVHTSGTDNTSYTMLYVRSNMSDLMMHIHTSFTDNTIYTMVYVRSLCLL